MVMSHETGEENANHWSDGSFVLEYTKLSKSSREIEVWTYPDGTDTKNAPIDESEVCRWLNTPPPRHAGQLPTAGLRLITQSNESGYPKFPMQKETLAHLLREWRFPNPELYWNAFYIGGSAAFVVGSGEETRINFIFGGGIFSYSIGGIFSYECRSNITSGCIISGNDIRPWADAITDKFLEVPNPFTIPVLMAEILTSTAIALRRSFIVRIKHIESQTGSRPSAEQREDTGQMSKTMPDYRAFAVELSGGMRMLGRSQLAVERARLNLEFVVNHLGLNWQDLPMSLTMKETFAVLRSRAKFLLSSLEYIRAEQQSSPARLQCQNMIVTNLIAQQDVTLSMEVARDSRELAAASRRDSSAMRVIAVLGTVFLPGTFIATVLALPLFKWDASTTKGVFSTRLWIYFVITIPLTIFTMAVMYFWLRRRERRAMELATKARTRGVLEGTQESQEVEKLFAGDPGHLV